MNKVSCPDCLGDGKETCHNPDHGFISAMGWHEIGRLGCPCCGNDGKNKVPNGGLCETCSGAGEVEEQVARGFCEEIGYNYDKVMERANG